MEQQKVFKTELFGFNKKMVLDYLYEVDERARNSEQELGEKIEALTSSNNELNEKLEEAEAQFQIISSKLNVERENSVQSSKLIGELNQEIEHQRRVIADKEREIQLLSERSRQTLVRAEESEKKLEHYDQLSHRVGDLIMEAQRSADSIVNKAQQEADKITEDAEKSTQVVYNEFINIKEDLGSIKEFTAQMFESINLKIAKLEEMLDSQTAKFSPGEDLCEVMNPNKKEVEIDFCTGDDSAEVPPKQLDKPYIGSFFRGRGISKF